MRDSHLPSLLATVRRWVILPAGLLTIAWLVATHLPRNEAARLNILKYDWLAHGSGYLVMAACWVTWLHVRLGVRPARAAVLVWFALIALGALDETTQPLAGRDCSLTDWLSDATGAAIAVTIVPLLLRCLALGSGEEKVLDHVHDRIDMAEHHPERHNP